MVGIVQYPKIICFFDKLLKIVVGSKLFGHVWQIVEVDCTHYNNINNNFSVQDSRTTYG